MRSHLPQGSLVVVAACVLTAMVSLPARADNFDALYVFGDSLSDAGNAGILSGGTLPGLPYSNGRFSNGNVWVQDMATTLGLPAAAKPSLLGGTDYAIGGATSGSGALNLGGELTAYGATHAVGDPNALYMIWIGANDLRAILSSSPGSPTVQSVVMNIDDAISALKATGAKNFLIMTVPDLGKTPAAISTGPAGEAAATGLTQLFNMSLENSLASVDAGLNLKVFDTAALLDEIAASPATYGFTDVTDSCLVGSVNYAGGTACANPNQYLFWDAIHPTAAGHQIVANAVLQTVPEPGVMTLLLGGFGVLAMVAVRKRRSDLVN